MPVIKDNLSKSEDYNKPFPSRLRSLIEQRATSQTELAKVLGITRQAVSSYSLGTTVPDIEKFEKMADYFGVSFDYLIGRSSSKRRDNIDISEKLGLSEYAIERLKQLKSMGFSALLSDLIFNSNFTSAIYQMHEMLSLDLKDGYNAIVTKDDMDKLANGEKVHSQFFSSGVFRNMFTTKAKQDMGKAIDEILEEAEIKGYVPSQPTIQEMPPFEKIIDIMKSGNLILKNDGKENDNH